MAYGASPGGVGGKPHCPLRGQSDELKAEASQSMKWLLYAVEEAADKVSVTADVFEVGKDLVDNMADLRLRLGRQREQELWRM